MLTPGWMQSAAHPKARSPTETLYTIPPYVGRRNGVPSDASRVRFGREAGEARVGDMARDGDSDEVGFVRGQVVSATWIGRARS